MIGNPQRLVLFSPELDPFDDSPPSKPDLRPIMAGYFAGLPPKQNWERIFNSLDQTIQGDALVPMLGRWLNEDEQGAAVWLKSQPKERLIDVSYESIQGPHIPIQVSDVFQDRYNKTLGEAIGVWFRESPVKALRYLDKTLEEDPSPILFQEVASSTGYLGSASGFFQTMERIDRFDNPATKGALLIALKRSHGISTNASTLFEYEGIALDQIDQLKQIEVAQSQKEEVDLIIKQFELSLPSE